MTATERAPLTDVAQLANLDRDETLEGYRDGVAGDREPGNNRSLSYWHGWRNGMIDGRHMDPDAAALALAKSYRLANQPALETSHDQ